MELTARKKEILKVVTERYIDTADPVSSKFIAQAMGGGLSSATIRNELADLVELGYLEVPVALDMTRSLSCCGTLGIATIMP